MVILDFSTAGAGVPGWCWLCSAMILLVGIGFGVTIPVSSLQVGGGCGGCGGGVGCTGGGMVILDISIAGAGVSRVFLGNCQNQYAYERA